MDSCLFYGWLSFSDDHVKSMFSSDDSEITLQEKLNTEVRSCPRCMMDIENPFIERCPRCYNVLPKIDLNCTGCVHRIICPRVEVKVDK